MSLPGSPTPGRDYAQLLGAMNELLAVLADDGGEEAALRADMGIATIGQLAAAELGTLGDRFGPNTARWTRISRLRASSSQPPGT